MPEQVTHIVDRNAIQQHQVLVGAAAAHIQAVLAFTTRLHAGQQLQGLEHVHLPEQGRNAFDLLHGHLHGTHA